MEELKHLLENNFPGAILLKINRKKTVHVFIDLLWYASLHETIHELVPKEWESLPDDEREKRINLVMWKIVKLQKYQEWMTWDRVVCPRGGEVSWVECLSCDDLAKDSTCPLLRIREEAKPRPKEVGRYGVTELCNPRWAYFDRICDYTQDWDSYTDLFLGTAVHRHVQGLYGETEQYVEKTFPDFKVVGYVDIIDQDVQILYELKTYATIKYLLQRDKPEEDHAFQAQAYYAMAREFYPWKRVKRIRVVYIGKTRDGKRFKEYALDPDPTIMEKIRERAEMLHHALLMGKPPVMRCTSWLCKFCNYEKECKRYP